MIKVTKVLILILLSFSATINGQQLSNQVLVPAAGLARVGVISYSQTIGETAVEPMSSGGYFLTQGFHQPGMIFITDTPPKGTGVDVYPNPATDFIYVKLFGEEARKIKIEVISLIGSVFSTVSLDLGTNYYYVQQVDITGLKYGIYLVRVTSDDLIISRIFKIEKM
jgi:hypothetical protein